MGERPLLRLVFKAERDGPCLKLSDEYRNAPIGFIPEQDEVVCDCSLVLMGVNTHHFDRHSFFHRGYFSYVLFGLPIFSSTAPWAGTTTA